MNINSTIEEMSIELGKNIRAIRLRQNLDQQTVAERSGIALNAVKNLESGRGATTRSLIAVLRSLGRAEWFGMLAPQVTTSPLGMLKRKKIRLRARRKIRRNDV